MSRIGCRMSRIGCRMSRMSYRMRRIVCRTSRIGSRTSKRLAGEVIRSGGGGGAGDQAGFFTHPVLRYLQCMLCKKFRSKYS